MRLLRVVQATADAMPDATADDAPAAHDSYRVDDDLDAQALPDFDLITAEPAEGADSADAD